MAVVDTYYEVYKRDVGRPAFVVFWENFIGTRSKINQQIMEDRLKTEDPAVLARMEDNIRDSIADLNKTRSDILRYSARASAEMDSNLTKILVAMVKAEASMKNTMTMASTQKTVASMKIATDLATTFEEAGQKRRKPFEEKRVDPTVRGAMDAASQAALQPGRTEGERLAVYEKMIGNLRQNVSRGTAEELGIIQAAIDKATAVGDHATANNIARTYFSDRQRGETLDAYTSRKLQAPSQQQAQQIANEIVRMGGISGGRLDMNALVAQVLPLFGYSQGDIQPYTELSVGYETRGPSVAIPGTSPTTEATRMTADIDRQLKNLEQEAERLRAKRTAVRPQNRFSYVMGNALLDPALFAVPAERRPAIEAVRALSPEQQQLMASLLAEAGGDPVKALKLFQEREGAPPAPLPAEEPVTAPAPTEAAPVAIPAEVPVEEVIPAIPTTAAPAEAPPGAATTAAPRTGTSVGRSAGGVKSQRETIPFVGPERPPGGIPPVPATTAPPVTTVAPAEEVSGALRTRIQSATADILRVQELEAKLASLRESAAQAQSAGSFGAHGVILGEIANVERDLALAKEKARTSKTIAHGAGSVVFRATPEQRSEMQRIAAIARKIVTADPSLTPDEAISMGPEGLELVRISDDLRWLVPDLSKPRDLQISDARAKGEADAISAGRLSESRQIGQSRSAEVEELYRRMDNLLPMFQKLATEYGPEVERAQEIERTLTESYYPE